MNLKLKFRLMQLDRLIDRVLHQFKVYRLREVRHMLQDICCDLRSHEAVDQYVSEDYRATFHALLSELELSDLLDVDTERVEFYRYQLEIAQTDAKDARVDLARILRVNDADAESVEFYRHQLELAQTSAKDAKDDLARILRVDDAQL